MLVTTANDLPGYKVIEVKGIVRGLVVRAPTITQGIFGNLRKIIGGNIAAYVEMCEQARKDAYELMCQHALEMGGQAVIAMRYETGEISSASGTSVTEILCYGTAVIIEKL